MSVERRCKYRLIHLGVFGLVSVLDTSNMLQGSMDSLFSNSSVKMLLCPDLSHLFSASTSLLGLVDNSTRTLGHILGPCYWAVPLGLGLCGRHGGFFFPREMN